MVVVEVEDEKQERGNHHPIHLRDCLNHPLLLAIAFVKERAEVERQQEEDEQQLEEEPLLPTHSINYQDRLQVLEEQPLVVAAFERQSTVSWSVAVEYKNFADVEGQPLLLLHCLPTHSAKSPNHH